MANTKVFFDSDPDAPNSGTTTTEALTQRAGEIYDQSVGDARAEQQRQHDLSNRYAAGVPTPDQVLADVQEQMRSAETSQQNVDEVNAQNRADRERYRK